MIWARQASAFTQYLSHSIRSARIRKLSIFISKGLAIALPRFADRRIRCVRRLRNSRSLYSAFGIPPTPPTTRWSTHHRSLSSSRDSGIRLSFSPTALQTRSAQFWSVRSTQGGRLNMQSDGVQNRLCRCDVSRSKAFSIPTIYWRQQIICCPYPAFVVP